MTNRVHRAAVRLLIGMGSRREAFGLHRRSHDEQRFLNEPTLRQMSRRYDAVLFDLLTALLDSWTLWSTIAGGEPQAFRPTSGSQAKRLINGE